MIYEFFQIKNNTVITQDDLLEFGKESGLSRKQILDEIIGCLYAPFLSKYRFDSTEYQITYNGLLRFNEFFNRENYVEYEIPFTILFSDKNIRFRRMITDTVLEDELKHFKNRGWSHNKSTHRLTKKARNQMEYKIAIDDVISALKPAKKKQNNYLDLIDNYGWNYRVGDNRGCNLHSRFMLRSTLIETEEPFLNKLLEYTCKPVDWGGSTIKEKDFIKLFNKFSNSCEKSFIIYDCISDGLIRYSDCDSLSLTSTGYTTIKTYIEHFRTIQLFIKKLDVGYKLEIGLNKYFLREIFETLEQGGFREGNGWYEKIITETELLSFFDELYWFFSEKKLCCYDN